MLTGFNTDIEHEGQVFHVQTQDRGREDPVVETMVYLGGRILASVSTPYADLAGSKEETDHDLLERMKGQHLDLINKILSGRFGEPSKRDLSELVVDFLETEIDEAGPQTEVEPVPDAEERKRRLQGVLERLEAQIEREAAAAAAVEPRPGRRVAVWIYGAGAAALLAAVVAFAPTIGELPGSTDPPRSAQEPIATPVEAELPVTPEAPAGEAGRPSEPPERIAAGPVAVVPEVSPPVEPFADPAVVARQESGAAPIDIPTLEPLPVEAPPPPVESWAGRLVPFADVDTPPRATRRDLPAYTRRAWRQRQEGVVKLDLLVDEKGYVSQVKVLEKIPGSDLHESTMDAAVGWRFAPARKAGQEVKVWKAVAVEFSIAPDHTEVVRILE